MSLKISAIFLILILMSVVFGMFSFGFLEHNMYNFCPIALAVGGDCSLMTQGFAIAIHHISGLSSFTQGIIAPYLISLLVLFLMIVVFVLVFENSLIHVFQRLGKTQKTVFQFQRNLLFLVSLHNKRDISAFSWALNTR